MKIALISCSKSKKSYPCAARELYSPSTLFEESYQYAKRIADEICILSAKYGLVPESDVIEPYDQTLKNMSINEQLIWADRVLEAIQKKYDINHDEFVILAGKDYYQNLIPHLSHYSLPLGKLTYGERISWLHLQNTKTRIDHPHVSNSPRTSSAKNNYDTSAACLTVHQLFNNMHRYSWNRISEIPFENGIYIVFENGEQYHGMDRIVRVGTHSSDGRLKKRLADHFIKENHDGSIFRKNIGKTILYADYDPYFRNWCIDTSKPENKSYLDIKKNAETEVRVSKILQENFTFTVFPVSSAKNRLRLEEAIISTLNHAQDFVPSPKWLGNSSPETEIRKSGLWLKQGLDAEPLKSEELTWLKRCCEQADENSHAKQYNIILPTVPATKRKTLGGKYTPLYNYLKEQNRQTVTLSFEEIESILGFQLPNSASQYTMWWSYTGHTQARAWSNAGYRVANANECPHTHSVTFHKVR